MAEVTVLVVGHDNRELLRLAIESFRRHNGDVPFNLVYWDNDSTDGAQEWGRENSDQLMLPEGPMGHHHAVPLDAAVQKVTTPYVLTLDNDTVTTGPILAKTLETIRSTGAFAVNPAPRFDMGTAELNGHTLVGQPRIDPCYALFRTPDLVRFVKDTSFGPRELPDQGKFYDTGGAIRLAAEGCGLKVIDVPEIWDAFTHFGSMTWGREALPGTPPRLAYEERLREVRECWRGIETSIRADTKVVVGPAQAYAAYVADNYNHLSEMTVFTPDDQAPGFADQAKEVTCHFRPIGTERIATGPNGDARHAGLPSGDVYRHFTRCEMPETVEFVPGAAFAAHRNVLRRYPQGWWRDLANWLASETGEFVPPMMERLWGALLTKPRIPHRYHNVYGWFDFETVYRDAVREAPYEAHFVEVGSYHGKSASFMTTEILNSHKKIRFDAVDYCFGSASSPEQLRPVFEGNLAGILHAVNVVGSTSVQAAKQYHNQSLDFVMIDADHEYPAINADITAWLPKMKVGGLIVGHDYDAVAFPGVVAAVKQAFNEDFDLVHTTWRHRVKRPTVGRAAR